MLCHSIKNKATSADKDVFHYLVELVPIEEGNLDYGGCGYGVLT